MPTVVIRPLQRPAPLRQSVYDALIDLIVGGELPPGQHIIETDLARQLGVSRQPVREALHRMETEGWVDLRPSQGAFVHVPTRSEVDELLDVRALLEAETARLAARAATGAQLARLREICAEGQEAAGQDDLGRAAAANDSFHAEIALAAGNSVLAELRRHRGPPGPLVLPAGRPGARAQLVARARRARRRDRGGRSGPGPAAGPRARRAREGCLPPRLTDGLRSAFVPVCAWAPGKLPAKYVRRGELPCTVREYERAGATCRKGSNAP